MISNNLSSARHLPNRSSDVMMSSSAAFRRSCLGIKCYVRDWLKKIIDPSSTRIDTQTPIAAAPYCDRRGGSVKGDGIRGQVSHVFAPQKKVVVAGGNLVLEGD